MAIKGSLSEASLPDVIQLLSFSLRSGCLSVTDGRNFGNIFIKDGKIIYATLLNRKDRLGDILVRKQIIDEVALKSALEEQKRSNKRIGEILIEKGLITKEILEKELSDQIAETIFTMLTWESGYFNFEADLLPGSEEFLVQLSPQELLLEGARRIDEWRKLEKRLPPFESVLVVKKEYKDIPLTEEELRVLQLINGERTIDEILKLSEFDFFDTCRTIYALISAGVVEKLEKTELAKRAIGDIGEYLNLGFAFFKTGMYDEAEREFRRVMEIAPDNVEALLYSGLIELKRNNLQKAEEFLKRANELEENPVILNNLGYLYNKLGRFDEARTYLQKANVISKENPRIICNLGITLFKQGEFDEAEKMFKEVIEKKPEYITPYIYLALIYVKLNDLKKAVEFLKECIDKFPRLAVFKNNLAVVYESLDLPEEAERLYRQAISDEPMNYKICRNLADFYYESQILGAAKEFYERIPDEEKDWEVLFKLGNIVLRLGDADAALHYWERANTLNPTHTLITQNIELLRKSRGV
ncbi:MAG: tetratricopeptide repeat protein [candidate division WOR-3 bacterium]|nr:tetratricopeptide repeat protein [candidate division WOR-3 bacterium]